MQEQISSVQADEGQLKLTVYENTEVKESIPVAYETANPIEITEPFIQKSKKVTLLDTVTVQAIICVIIGIAYLIINMLFSNVSVGIFDTYTEQAGAENETSTFSDTVKSFMDFINSTPEKSDD